MDSHLSAQINELKRQQELAHDELTRLGDQCARIHQDFEKLSVSDLNIQSSIDQLDHRIQSNRAKEITPDEEPSKRSIWGAPK